MKFLPKGKYFGFPKLENFKFLFDVSTKATRDHSFTFFNPKGKKAIVWKLIKKAFPIISLVFRKSIYHQNQNGEFYSSIQSFFQKEVGVTGYLSTDKDKLVLRVSSGSEVIGFLKVGLNDLGNDHLQQEKLGWEKLGELGMKSIISSEMTLGNHHVLCLDVVKGKELPVDADLPRALLERFYYNESFSLLDHPRYVQLREYFEEYDINFNARYKNCEDTFYSCFEHGDFAPWNIIVDNGSLEVIDLEFCCVEGIEGMDEIKFRYCIGRYIKGASYEEILDLLNEQLTEKLVKYILPMFLIKEINYRKEMGHEFSYELNVLKLAMS